MTAGFAVGVMLLSASMALLSYELTRRFLLDERERNAVRVTYIDANIVRASLATDQVDIGGVLRSLDTGGNRRALVRRSGIWYSRTANSGVERTIPAELVQQVERGVPSVQRVQTDNGPALVIGVPIGQSTAFYEIDSMQELDRSLNVLALVLTMVATITTALGALMGWYTGRYVTRPLITVANAAREITAGDFAARLDPAAEPELANLTNSFNQMVDQLSQRMERDRRFAADVSHELRSPLQTLAAAASVLAKRQPQLDDRTAVAATLVTEEVARFQRLVTDLLELARSDQPAERAPVNVTDLAKQVCRTRGMPTGIVSLDDGTEPVWCIDRRRFERVLENLLDNAERHGGGPVAVRFGQANGVRFMEVDDEGPGVNPKDRQAVFGRFVRGRSASARGDSDGTGLGLALVAQHVTAHGGKVQVTDRPGGGARFRVEIPEAAA